MAKHTPLFEKHEQLNAKMVEFAGFEMPVQYLGIKREHTAVREAAGVFDVSHMGQFFISGPEALDLIQKITVNDAARLVPGKAQYSAMCFENGGIVDDLLVYRLAGEKYMLVVNAANIDKDREWIRSHQTFDATFEDRSERMALLAVQGPKSVELLQQLTELELDQIKYYSFTEGAVAGQPDVIVSATGYTGERGFELYIDTQTADPGKIWDALFDAGETYGLVPAGLGARDTLRLEMGLALYGNDITKETTPLEAGLGWLIKFEKGTFIGSDALEKQKAEGVKRRLTGFVIEDSRQIPRKGYDICNEDGARIGFVTSGTQSITLGKGIGMGYVPAAYSAENNTVYISVRRKPVPAVTKKPPFFER